MQRTQECKNCGTKSTPFWRKVSSGHHIATNGYKFVFLPYLVIFTLLLHYETQDKNDGKPLCNACGLYHAKNDAPRPKLLWRADEGGGIVAASSGISLAGFGSGSTLNSRTDTGSNSSLAALAALAPVGSKCPVPNMLPAQKAAPQAAVTAALAQVQMALMVGRTPGTVQTLGSGQPSSSAKGLDAAKLPSALPGRWEPGHAGERLSGSTNSLQGTAEGSV